MKKSYILISIFCCVIFGLAGCKEKGEDFIGLWERVDIKAPNSEDTISITLEDGVFHIYRKRRENFNGLHGDYVVDEVRARAKSENVLTVLGGFVPKLDSTFVIRDGVLSTSNGAIYQRI